MVRMIRKQVYIEAEQDALLKRLAKQLGVSEAELIRRGIDYVQRVDVEHATISPARDLSAWEEEKAFIEQRMRRFRDVPQSGRTWTREELYEQRLGWPRRPAD